MLSINVLKKTEKQRQVNILSEIRFVSSLTKAEIEENFKNIDFFSGVEAGLDEALAYETRTANSSTIVRKRSFPESNVVTKE